jgi:putative RecB family exonuclease
LTDEARRYTRSISQLKSYSKCGEQFYLERIRRQEMPSRPAPWTLLGVAVHDTIMAWEQADHDIDALDHYYGIYDTLAETAWLDQPNPEYWFLPPMAKHVKNSIASYRERGAEQIRTYIDKYLYRPWEISCLERQFEIDLDGVTVKGAIDRILYFPDDDFYLVEDLKTGTVKDEADHRQLAFYAFVARELWGIPVNHGRYWYLKADRPSETYDLGRFGREYWVTQFKALDKAIELDIYLSNPGQSCQLCSVRPWCRSQGWLQIGEEL